MIKELFDKQREVDELIKDKINIPFNKTIEERKIALKVELGEFANEVGFFKYWKESHVQDLEKIKDEWADCFAFAISIANTYEFDKELIQYFDKIEIKNISGNVKDIFNRLVFNKMYDYVDVECFIMDLYKIGVLLGFSINELNEAYIQKSLTNIVRAQGVY